MRYAVIIEPGENNYGAYVPDLPGCVATGGTLEKVKAEIAAAIGLHLDGLREDGLRMPAPTSRAEYVEVAAARQDRAVRRDRSSPTKSRIVMDGQGIKPSTPAPKPSFLHPTRGAGERPSTPPPKPRPSRPKGRKDA